MICDVSLLLFAIRQQTLLIAALLHTCLATLNATKHTSIKHSSFITTYNVMMRQIWPWCIPCDVQYVYITMYTSLFLVKGLNKAFLISLNILNLTIIFRKNLYSMLSENLARPFECSHKSLPCCMNRNGKGCARMNVSSNNITHPCDTAA